MSYTKISDGPRDGADRPKDVTKPRILRADDRTLQQLRNMGSIQVTTRELALCLAVSEPTLLKFLNEYPEARAAYEMGKGQGKVSLRRLQFSMAARSAAMAIHLGKTYLGQRDSRNAELSRGVEIVALMRETIAACYATTDAPEDA